MVGAHIFHAHPVTENVAKDCQGQVVNHVGLLVELGVVLRSMMQLLWSGHSHFEITLSLILIDQSVVIRSCTTGDSMSIRQTRSPVRHELFAQVATSKVATTSSLVYVIFILMAFALVSYIGMASNASPAVVSPKPDVIQTYIHSPSNTGLTLWSSDFHISPIADVKHLLNDFGVTVIDKSLSGHCHLMNTCETDLRVINKHNGIDLTPCTNALRREFYHSYRDDPEMKKVDAFICNHAASMCELFMPFKKPMIVIASTRYGCVRLCLCALKFLHCTSVGCETTMSE